MPDQPTPAVFGYTSCRKCGTAVLNEIAYKTDGHCADCFRAHAAEILAPVMTVVAGRERLVLRTSPGKRSPGERAQRARARKRKKPDRKERDQLVARCADRARRRLAAILPELYEILLADERANAGLNSFTIDMALKGEPCSSSLEWLAAYHAITEENHGDPSDDNDPTR